MAFSLTNYGWECAACPPTTCPPTSLGAAGVINGYSTVKRFGTGVAGSSTTQLNLPKRVAAHPDGRVLIADMNRVVVCSLAADNILTHLGQVTLGVSQQPGVAVHPDGRVIISTFTRNQVDAYALSAGNVFTLLGTFGSGVRGSGTNQLSNPLGVAVHPDGRVLVADTDNSRIMVLSLDGSNNFAYLSQFSTDAPYSSTPEDVAVLPDGRVVVALNTYKLAVLSLSAGNVLAPLNAYITTGPPRGVATSPDGRILYANANDNKIEVLSLSVGNGFTQLGTFGTGVLGTGLNMLNSPRDVAVHPDGRVIIADYGNHQVLV